MPDDVFSVEFGVPLENCTAVPGKKKGVFQRRFSKKTVEVTCAAADAAAGGLLVES